MPLHEKNMKMVPSERARLMAEVARLARWGHSQQVIAERVGVSRAQVGHYLKTIHAQYLRATIPDRRAAVLEKIDQLRDLRATAEDAWIRSGGSREKLVEETSGGGEKAKRTKTVEGQVGDPRYLEIIRQCLADERDLLGLDEALKVDVAGTMVHLDWNQLFNSSPPAASVGELELIDPISARLIKEEREPAANGEHTNGQAHHHESNGSIEAE